MQTSMLVVLVGISIVSSAQGATIRKSMASRSLAAAGVVVDPHCKTGIVSLKLGDKPQSCCAGYCGACNDYDRCKNVRGQDSEYACCASRVYESRCGNAPANVCLKTCSQSTPPCIMDIDLDSIAAPKIEVTKGVPPCGDVVPFARQSHANAVDKGEKLTDVHVTSVKLQSSIDEIAAMSEQFQDDLKDPDLSASVKKHIEDISKKMKDVGKDLNKNLDKAAALQKKLQASTKITHELELEVKTLKETAEADAKMITKARMQVVEEKYEDVSQFLDNTSTQLAKAAAEAKAKAEAAEKAAKEASAKKAAEAEAARKAAAAAKAAAEEAARKAAEAKKAEEAAKVAEAAKLAAAAKAKAEAEKAAKTFNYKQETLGRWSYIKAPKGSSEWMGSATFLRSPRSGRGLVSYGNHGAHGPPVVWWRLGQEGPYAGTIAGNTEYQGKLYMQWKNDSNDGEILTNLWGNPGDTAQMYPKGSCAAYKPCQSRVELLRLGGTRFQIKILGEDLCLKRSKKTFDVNGGTQWGYWVKWQPCCPAVDNDWDAPGWDIMNSKLPQASC